eukprot:1156309-Pelagomonas_calceolata.AAC.3
MPSPMVTGPDADVYSAGHTKHACAAQGWLALVLMCTPSGTECIWHTMHMPVHTLSHALGWLAHLLSTHACAHSTTHLSPQMPSHTPLRAVLGWLAHSLTTSSLLSAVGLSAGPVGTVATSAGIKARGLNGYERRSKFVLAQRVFMAEEWLQAC